MRRSEKLDLRVSKLEKSIIQKKAFESGHNVASYLRLCGLNKELKQPYTLEELEILREISRLASGLTRIGTLMKEHNRADLHQEVILLSGQLKELLNHA